MIYMSKKIYCLEKNKNFTLDEFSKFCNVNYETIKKFIQRNKNKEVLKYKNYNIKVIDDLSVNYLKNKQWKNKEKYIKNNEFDNLEFINDWKILSENNPGNKDYKEFYSFLLENYQKYGDKFNCFEASKKWNKKTDLWMCDTETTFTALVPPEFLFKDIKKGYGNNVNETLENLHIKIIDDKSILNKLSSIELKQVTKKGIKEFFKDNPKIKPYMWAWNCLNFKTGEYHLLNYYEAVEFIDTIKKNQKHYYHNLSYDAYYIWNALVDEKNYKLYYYNVDEAEIDDKYSNEKKQPNRSIKIFANNKKIFSVKIKNSKGKKIILECTYLKTIASVNSLGKILNKPKLEINYLTPRSKNHVFTEQEKNYIKTDVEIVVEYITSINNKYKLRFNKDLNWGITIGKTSFDNLINIVGKKEFNKMFGKKWTKRDDDFKEFQELAKKTNNEFFKSERFETYVENKYDELIEKYEKLKLPFKKYKISIIKEILEWENPLVINYKEYNYLKDYFNGGYTNYNIIHVGKIHENISSTDIKSSYPGNWQQLKMPYGKVIYNCDCDDNNLLNSSKHFKLYELNLKKDIKIIKGKENLIPVNIEFKDENDNLIKAVEYYPFLEKGTYKLSQYMLQIFYTLFNPNKDDYELKKTNCFNQKIINGFKKYVDLWKAEKETPNLKIENPSYRDFTKLSINTPYGKFGQKPIIDETIFYIDKNNNIVKEVVKDKNKLEEIEKFSYLPVAIATTDIARLRLLSLIEAVGWQHWHNSDTDSCKFCCLEKLKLTPEFKPTYLNLITGEIETIYNENGMDNFGKWELEWTANKFKCAGKKKYIYLTKDFKTHVVCAGAPESVKEKMTFENFFAGYHPIANNKNMVTDLNGLPVVLPTTFQIKNIFKSKHLILMGYKHLLHDYYINDLIRVNNIVNEHKEKYDETLNVINYNINDVLNSQIGVFV